MLFFPACSTYSGNSEASVSTMSKNWHAIASEPTVFYPTDYKAKGETEYKSGEWIYVGKASFFIPKDGTPTASRDQLNSEVLALRKKYGSRPYGSSESQVQYHAPTYEEFAEVVAMGYWIAISPALVVGAIAGGP